MVVVFWFAYLVLMLSLLMWLASHPLSIGGCVLLLYMGVSVLVSFVISFVAGVFLFLTGVSGMMVAFLYVVALCPNPVFKVGNSSSLVWYYLGLGGLVLFCPVVVLILSGMSGFGLEMGGLGESFQWMREPCMITGLAELMPFLGLLLFLCMVSVVSLCGQQKQCLGGQGLMFEGLLAAGHTKRSYA